MAILPSRFRLIIAKFKSMPFSDFLSKVLNRIYKNFRVQIKTIVDKFCDTRASFNAEELLSILDKNKIIISDLKPNSKLVLTEKYMNHQFDLLGSNWVQNTYSEHAEMSKKTGIDNTLNFSSETDLSPINKLHRSQQKKSLEIYNLVDSNYLPIDWQFDFQNNYRWSIKDSSAAIKYGTIIGPEVKVPIELGRMQHLPQLALFALSDKDLASRYVKEVKNQIIDFIAFNPPRYGVNWIFSMDVGIRVANILIAFDICRQICPDEMGSEFTSILTSSVYDHGLHIVNNLEYSRELTSNHYLANIVGLLFVSNYLKSSKEIDSWLAFSIQELISEFSNQYYDDGVNFEGSSSYHRLSTEMLIYARAIILGMSSQKLKSLRQYSSDNWTVKPKLNELENQDFYITDNKIQLPIWFDEKLANAVQFSYDITKQDGLIWQYGDNDSGRFIKLIPIGASMDDGKIWENKCLDHSELFSAANGIFEDCGFPINSSIIYSIIQNLARDKKIKIFKKNNASGYIFNNEKLVKNNELIFRKKIIIRVTPPEHKINTKLNQELQYSLYPNGGILVYKSERMFLGLNCVPNGTNGNGGHNHNDQLSIELQVDGVDVSADPGTYLYTSNPEERNNFRSVQAHNTLRTDHEPNSFFGNGDALFAKENSSIAKFIDVKKDSAVMQLIYGQVIQQRSVSIREDHIVILDESNYDFENELNTFGRFSPGYGIVEDKINNLEHILVEYQS
jgi:hypothetical protein